MKARARTVEDLLREIVEVGACKITPHAYKLLGKHINPPLIDAFGNKGRLPKLTWHGRQKLGAITEFYQPELNYTFVTPEGTFYVQTQAGVPSYEDYQRTWVYHF